MIASLSSTAPRLAVRAEASFVTQTGHAASVPLTRVSLAYIETRLKFYLRFGVPARTVNLDHWRRCAIFLPGAMFCRMLWQANDYGTTRWQLMVMQTCTPFDAMQRLPGVRPGARLLLKTEGKQAVQTVLQRIDAIEELGIAPAVVSPAYWRTLGNRFAARLPLPEYSMERHAAWLTGRELR